jgi:hypothetical protein
MKITSALFGVALAGSVIVGGGAQADTIYAGPTPELPTDQSFTVNFNSGAATSSALSFTINGYDTLDGQNYYEDDFSLSLNGTTIFTGTFNLGGGSNATQAVIYLNTLGATYTNPTSNGTNCCGGGGQENISFASVPLLAGANSLVFTYTSLSSDSGHAGFQGAGDEGWGVQNVAASAVPEASTWLMMLAGFAALGFAGYRRDKVARPAA